MEGKDGERDEPLGCGAQLLKSVRCFGDQILLYAGDGDSQLT